MFSNPWNNVWNERNWVDFNQHPKIWIWYIITSNNIWKIIWLTCSEITSKNEHLKDLTIFDITVHNLIGEYLLYLNSITGKERKNSY